MPNIVRMPALKAKTGHASHASIYPAIHAGLFPKPVPIGLRAVGWPEDEVDAVIAARIAGKSDAEMRALVTALHGKRAAIADQYARAAGVAAEVAEVA